MKVFVLLLAAAGVLALVVWFAMGAGAPPAPVDEPTGPVLAPTSFEAVTGPKFKVDAVAEPAAPPPPLAEEAPEPEPLLSLPPGGMVYRASDGTELDGILVQALADGENGLVEVARCNTSKGRFDFGHEVRAQKPRYLAFTWTETLKPRERKTSKPRSLVTRLALADVRTPLNDIEQALDTGWIAGGLVANKAGKPLVGVAIEREAGDGAVTDADGRWQIRDIDPQLGVLRLNFTHRNMDTLTSDVYRPANGQHVALWDVTLTSKGKAR